MLEKMKTQFKEHKAEWIQLCLMSLYCVAASTVSYYLGYRHGMNAFTEWLTQELSKETNKQ